MRRVLVVMDLTNSSVTWRVLGAAIDVHRHLGPGLLESAYRSCLVDELRERGLSVELEVPIPIEFKGRKIEGGYRADIVVENEVLIELKAVERLLPIHEAQTLTYLRLGRIRVGLLLNFNQVRMRDGIRRFIAGPSFESRGP